MNYIEKFKELSENILHGNSSYFEHSIGVYNILKNMNAPEYICIAGLYHSIYDTETFKTNINITRKELINIIGNKSESLVFKFCHITDRYNNILNNGLDFDKETHYALCFIEYANLKEQSSRIDDHFLVNSCLMLQEKITILSEEALKYEKHLIDGKELYIFDNLLEKYHIDFLYHYCNNSLYKPNHRSNLSSGTDCRFSSTISKEEFEETKLLPTINKISSLLKKSLYIGHHYINHYGLLTGVSEHCDGDSIGQYTILIFPNNIWPKTWGGEIAFYSENAIHNMLEYKPGRIIVFDARISHKVMPLTRDAESDRYSITIKSCTNDGLDVFGKIYNPYLRIEP